MHRFNERVGKIEKFVGVAMMSVIAALVFAAAIARYFRMPIIWSVDVAQLLFIWICMIGADVGMKNKAHIGVDMVVRLFPDTLNKIITLATYLLCLGFQAFLIYWGVFLFSSNILRKYATLDISYSYGTAAVPIGAALMVLTTLEHLIDLIRNWNVPGVGVPKGFAEAEDAGQAPNIF